MTTFLKNFDYLLAVFGTVSIFFTAFFSWISFFLQLKFLQKFLNFFLPTSLFLIGSSLIVRWYTAHYFPLSNLYESLLFLTWCLLFLSFLIQEKSKSFLILFLISPITLLSSSFATLTLPPDMQKTMSLVPALQSNWLMMHVSMMMLSYATLILGSLLSIFYFFLTKNFSIPFFFPNIKNLSSKKQLLLKNLDLWSYRTIGFGFPMLTLGIIAGAVWANDAWGSYWSWDPKETWALITWLIFAAYLHARVIKGWEGEKASILGSIGFLIVWICYLGVNFLGKGLHTYGWIL
jgi:cytochrome c-type biogenesis protein CcsB